MRNYRSGCFSALLAAWLVVFLPGCGGTYKATQVKTVPLEVQEKVIYKNFWLKTSVGVLSIDTENQSGFLKAKLRLKNLTSSTVDAEIKIKFLDRTGYDIEDNWGWAPLPLESGEIKSLERIAPSKSATDFRVILKFASDSPD